MPGAWPCPRLGQVSGDKDASDTIPTPPPSFQPPDSLLRPVNHTARAISGSEEGRARKEPWFPTGRDLGRDRNPER